MKKYEEVKICCEVFRKARYSDSRNYRVLDALIDKDFLRFYIENVGFPIFSIGMYLALCFVLSSRCKSFREWISRVFDFSDVNTLGYLLFRLFCTIYGLGLIPGVLVVFFLRWFFSIKIRKGGGDK